MNTKWTKVLTVWGAVLICLALALAGCAQSGGAAPSESGGEMAAENGGGTAETSALLVHETLVAGWDYTVGIRSNGTAISTGYNRDERCEVSEWSNLNLLKN